jgi:hypothetical protein
MKVAVRIAILGVALQGIAHAAEPGTTTESVLRKDQGKVAVVQQPSVPARKNKVARKKAKPAEAAKTESPVAPIAQEKQDKVTAPSETSEQSVQIRGVRG